MKWETYASRQTRDTTASRCIVRTAPIRAIRTSKRAFPAKAPMNVLDAVVKRYADEALPPPEGREAEAVSVLRR